MKKSIFCLDKISFRRDYKSCRIGVVVVDVRCPTFMGTLRLYNFCNFGATLLGFGTVFTNIILHGIRNFGKNRITLTPQKCPKTPQKTLNMNLTIIFSFFSLGLDLPNHFG